VVTHQLQVERRTGKVRRPETDVLPLCHATNITTLCLNPTLLLCHFGFLWIGFVGSPTPHTPKRLYGDVIETLMVVLLFRFPLNIHLYYLSPFVLFSFSALRRYGTAKLAVVSIVIIISLIDLSRFRTSLVCIAHYFSERHMTSDDENLINLYPSGW